MYVGDTTEIEKPSLTAGDVDDSVAEERLHELWPQLVFRVAVAEATVATLAPREQLA